MKSCFVAGTLVMAVVGMVAIEKIKSEIKSFQQILKQWKLVKRVPETYIREGNYSCSSYSKRRRNRYNC